MHIRAMLIEIVSGGVCKSPLYTHSADAKLMQQLLQKVRNDEVNQGTVNCDNAGTVARFLTAYLSTLDGCITTIEGAQRMTERPIKPLVDALITLGADISYLKKEGSFPLQVKGKKLIGGTVFIDAELSSQYVSALMLIAPLLEEGIEIRWNNIPTSFKYIRLTADMLQNAGVGVNWNFDDEEKLNGVRIERKKWIDKEIYCESDWSSAAFWYAAVSIRKDIKIRIRGLDKKSIQPDVETYRIFKKIGVETQFLEDGVLLTASPVDNKKTINVSLVDNPDIVPAFVVACCANNINFEIQGVNSLRVKECDRVLALKNELQKLGYIIEDSVDKGILAWGGDRCQLINTPIETYGDHRIAMAMSLMTLRYDTILMNDIDVVHKSYPHFWEHIKQIIEISKF